MTGEEPQAEGDHGVAWVEDGGDERVTEEGVARIESQA